jgi:hypothetical protein
MFGSTSLIRRSKPQGECQSAILEICLHTLFTLLKGLAGTQSSRPLLQIAPPMNRLDVLGMVVSPSPSHPFGLDVVGHNLVVIREGCATDCTFPVLLGDLSVQQLSHLCW